MDQDNINLWKETFFKNNFSVDQCLAEYTQKSDLETLRKDLRNYGAELQLHMSEILKNETEAIVNLAEYLTNLNSKIENFSIPISQLLEEIRTLYSLIKSAKNNYELLLNNMKDNTFKQNHIHLKLGILNSSLYIRVAIKSVDSNSPENLFTLERIVNKYSFQKIYLNESNLMTTDIQSVIQEIEIDLVNNVNQCFLEALENNDKEILLKCLRMYVDLQKQPEAYKIFRKNILRPSMEKILREKYLEQQSNDLNSIYTELKGILDKKVEILNELVAAHHTGLKSFNFILNSFWNEFDNLSREGLPHITAPGNPDLFQKRFNSTYNFLKYVALKAGNENLINGDESFREHLKRFNLPVYFEIKFQQIAGNFEADTIELKVGNRQLIANNDNNSHAFKLSSTLILWHGLQSCFNHTVYIDQLADQFIRLSMMLLSRYIELQKKLLTEISLSETISDNKEEVDMFLVDVLIDLTILKTLVANIQIENSIFAIINTNFWPTVVKVLQLNDRTLEKARTIFKVDLEKAKINDCLVHLQYVTAIPRLYRRTNRNPPKEASSYMVEGLTPILNFRVKFETNLNELNVTIDNIIIEITKQYTTLVQEVLRSVCRTEEYLRKLKNRNLTSTGEDANATSSDIGSDEGKIREQIKYDVGYFCDKLYPLGSKTAKYLMDLLKKEVFFK